MNFVTSQSRLECFSARRIKYGYVNNNYDVYIELENGNDVCMAHYKDEATAKGQLQHMTDNLARDCNYTFEEDR